MLQVDTVNYIRSEVNAKGHSYSEVARRTNTDARTVKKYADQEEFQAKQQQRKKQSSPVMDPVKEQVDQWLIDDGKKKKKYRRTAKRMWQQLCDECDFQGSERTVRDYVSKRKVCLQEESSQAALPLESKPGDAQVDFGQAPFQRQGEIVELPYLVLSFPHSNAFLVQVFESENQDCFLEGLKRFFDHIGGVPRRIRFDNLSPAVTKVLPHGKRQLTDGFYRFVLHYGFAYEFCNPGAGNEKGHVEAMVKYVRNNFFLPEQHIFDLEELNAGLWKICIVDRDRAHYEKKSKISTLFEADQQALFYLPEKSYKGIRYETVKANKYGYVTIDGSKYSTSPRYAGQGVLVGITHDTIQILTDQYEIIVRHRRSYEGEVIMKWQPYLSLMARRPNAMKYTSFYDQLPQPWQDYLQACTQEEVKEALKLLSTLLKDHRMELATEALQAASRHAHPSPDAIRQVFHQLVHGRGFREAIPIQQHVPTMPEAQRGMTRYDDFFQLSGRET
ncbi:IS21 family transposase [Salisediminibacterium halotolerans]|uniref:Transposase n=1 Tax=Salisediminibacterium halotolerans TaxID=517425 RepID=A0A1H9WY84_9BACI|nr:IS21 family transposase [Salisediminibacterium haloalkalitolerans]SES38804.1 Transposase [Salisediminibacterium haloalkalitolerans]